jgi:hypothetical protein
MIHLIFFHGFMITERTYHILSILAKYIMIVPVSTISSKSTFSLASRVIEERQRTLSSEHVEMVCLLEDWEQGDARQQHNMENKELEEKMTNLYLDGYGPDRPPAPRVGAGAEDGVGGDDIGVAGA